jgi:hypothetical protein
MGIAELYKQGACRSADRLPAASRPTARAAAMDAGYTGIGSSDEGTGIGGNYPATSSAQGNWYSNNPANGGAEVEYYAAGALQRPNVLHTGTYNGYGATGMCLDTETDRFNTLWPKTDKLSLFGRAAYEISPTA